MSYTVGQSYEITRLIGLVMQPIVGALSDKCTSRWGRRRPFLVGGSVIVILNLATIGWTRDIVGLVIDRNDDTKVRVIIYKVISPIY